MVTVAAGAARFPILSQALTMLPVGTCYAIWTEIGVVGIVVLTSRQQSGPHYGRERGNWLRNRTSTGQAGNNGPRRLAS